MDPVNIIGILMAALILFFIFSGNRQCDDWNAQQNEALFWEKDHERSVRFAEDRLRKMRESIRDLLEAMSGKIPSREEVDSDSTIQILLKDVEEAKAKLETYRLNNKKYLAPNL
jgi:hypothetical protein